MKKVKKKKPVQTEPAAAPEVDLFSFDTPASAPAPAANGDASFDAFQTAHAPTPTLTAPPISAAAATANDDFGDFQQIAPTSAVQFDAFGSTPAAPAQPVERAPVGNLAIPIVDVNAPSKSGVTSLWAALEGRQFNIVK